MICLLLTTFRWLTRHTYTHTRDRAKDRHWAKNEEWMWVTLAWRRFFSASFRSRVSELCWQWKIQAMKIETLWLCTVFRHHSWCRRCRRLVSLCTYMLMTKEMSVHTATTKQSKKKSPTNSRLRLWLRQGHFTSLKNDSLWRHNLRAVTTIHLLLLKWSRNSGTTRRHKKWKERDWVWAFVDCRHIDTKHTHASNKGTPI